MLAPNLQALGFPWLVIKHLRGGFGEEGVNVMVLKLSSLVEEWH